MILQNNMGDASFSKNPLWGNVVPPKPPQGDYVLPKTPQGGLRSPNPSLGRGGETEFPNLDLKIEPKEGRMVYFENYIKKEICADSCHRSLPVERGEKWAFNLWYHIR